MSFNFGQPSYHRNNGMLLNQPYHSSSYKRPTTSPNPFATGRQNHPYPYYYNNPYYRNANSNNNRDDKDIHENFVQDLREALNDEIKKKESQEDEKNNINDGNNNNNNNDIVSFTFEVPTDDTANEAKSELNSMLPSSLYPTTEESNIKTGTNATDSEIKTTSIPLQFMNNDSLSHLDIYKKGAEIESEIKKGEMESERENENKNFKNDKQTLKFYPKADLFEDEKCYYINIDLPGMTKKQINVEITENNEIRIFGERKLKHYHYDHSTGDRDNDVSIENPEKTNKIHYLVLENAYGKFERSFMIPSNADTDKIQAKMEAGVLEVILHKKEVPKKQVRTIEIH